MQSNYPKCTRFVADENSCSICKGLMIKHGKSSTGKQRLRCKACNKTVVRDYSYSAYLPDVNLWIQKYLIKGVGIRGISDLLSISVSTVMKRIVAIASTVKAPESILRSKYELDEMHTYIGTKSNPYWIVYALQEETGNVTSFNIGKRNLATLRIVVSNLVNTDAKRIFTDKLTHYKSLIPSGIHSTKQYGTNHIERHHLTLRTHLERLSRKTICFSRSVAMLSACLKIYFWS